MTGPSDPIAPPASPGGVIAAAANRYDAREWTGAFGDLGTLVPFVAAYILVAGMDPLGILLAFGLALLFSGLYYRTPMPVQPMKVIGTIAVTQAALAVTPVAIVAAGLLTGVLWLALGLSGMARRFTRLVSAPLTAGLVLGLGLALGWQASLLLATDWLFGGLLAGLTLVLLRVLPMVAMPMLLAAGAAYALWLDPTLSAALALVEPGLRQPEFVLASLSWNELAIAAMVLTLPQIPLTLGNAVIAVSHEHNRLFPQHPIEHRTVCLTTGALNIGSALLGGVPLCHGAGGLAGHVRFGARSGGATVLLGSLLLVLALFFSDAVATLFRLFPAPILGVMLLVAALELVRGAGWPERAWRARTVMLLTAALCLWHIALAFAVGFALQFLLRLQRTSE